MVIIDVQLKDEIKKQMEKVIVTGIAYSPRYYLVL
jgi:hypothetical protein